MANIQLVPGSSIKTSSILVSTELSGDCQLTVQEALDLSLELPMAVTNLNAMFWSPVPHASSSHVRAIEYQKSCSKLRVHFPTGTYVYFGVPSTVVSEITAAKSAGSYIQQELVKNPGTYPVVKE